MSDNINGGQVYQQINWGWLYDYNGYKFAPNTFFEQLYTREGKSFSQDYNKKWDDLSTGKLVAGAAQKLVKEIQVNSVLDPNSSLTTFEDYNTGFPSPENNGGTYLGYYPTYFNDGIPEICDEIIASDIFGDVNNDNANKNTREQKARAIYAKQKNIELKKVLPEKEEILRQAEQIIINASGATSTNDEEFIRYIQDNPSVDSVIQYQQAYSDYDSCASQIEYNESIIQTFLRNTILQSGDLNVINKIQAKTIEAETVKASNGFTGNLTGNVTGNADTATRLQNLNKIGNINQPVYFEDGQPKVCQYPSKDSGWLGIPRVVDYNSENETGGVMDIGRYIDFHDVENDENSYSTRLGCANTDEQITINLPSTSGTLVLATDTIANATNAENIKVVDIPNSELTSDSKFYLTAVTGTGTGQALKRRSDIYLTLEEGTTSSAILMGAAWNDYAEFRNQIEIIEPGYCVASTDDGRVYKTTEKFQACDGIVSDTYGFAIGKTEVYQTPLAVAGRVLAYYEGNKTDYHAGDTVCAGPNGKICKMTREEIKEYPDRIIGIVSEIPEYEEWTGRKVNNRIWIKVK